MRKSPILVRDVLTVLLLTAGATGLRYAFNPNLGFRSPLLFHILAVAVAAQIAGTVPGLAATGLSVVLIDYFFVPPFNSFAPPPDPGDAMALVLFTAVGITLSVFGGWQKRSRDALKHLHDRMALKHQVARMGTFEWFIRENRNVWTPELCELYGIEPGSFDNTLEAWKKLVHPDDAIVVAKAIEAAIAKRQPHLEYDFRISRSGETRWLHGRAQLTYSKNGEAEMMMGVNIDITEQKRAEQQVRESGEQFRTLANAIPQLCWMAKADGWIFWYNERWYRYTGTTPEQMEGWGWQAVHDRASLPAVLEQWKASIASGEPFEMVFPLRGADGVLRPFLTRGMPVKDENGTVVRWFGTNTDITDLKRGEMAQQILGGLVQVCSACRRIHEDHQWYSMEGYLRLHSTAKFSHGMCPDCSKQWSQEKGPRLVKGA